MAGKARPMSQIKQLLRLHSQGMPVKRIARTLGISRNTVKGYLRKVSEGTKRMEDLLALDNPVLEAHFHAGNPAYKDPRYAHLVSNLSYYETELKKTGVTRELLWEEYIAGCPGGYSYTQFCFHLRQRLASINPTMVLEHRAGEKLFIDFAGKTLSYIDRDTGEEISCPVLVACLPFSDYAFAMAVPSQGTEDFLHGLECCLRHLGGVPQALVPDNLKGAVERADRYEPTINRTMEEFANHYGTVVVPARARKPQDKASVENQVKNVYTRVFARLRNQRFFDLASLNAAIVERMAAHNQTRMQKKAYCRLERFRNAEKPLLSPLPPEGFQVVRYAKRKVGQNNYVLVEGYSYSVPFQYISQHVQVAYTRRVVRIYAEGKQVAAHTRKFGGGYTAVKEHLSSQHRYYLGRSPDYFIERAEKLCPELHKLIKLIFQQPGYPENQYRTCEGLLRLYRQSDPHDFARACTVAMEYGMLSYKKVEGIIKSGTLYAQPDTVDKPLPGHGNIRGRDYYVQARMDI